MKILFVCHRFPYPPRDGAKLRAFHIVKHLARSHDVTLASPVRNAEEEAEAPGVAPYCARYITARLYESVQNLRMIALLPTPTPSSMGYFHSPQLARRVESLLARQRFDLAFVLCSSMAHYIPSDSALPKILDFVDMDSQKWLDYARFKPAPVRYGYWLEGAKLERAEKSLARRFDVCTTVTRGECETLDAFGTGAHTDWFPNGVDAEYFRPSADPYDADTVCFVGRMDYFPNEECMVRFCAEVLPRIQARRPGARLVVVGANPSPAVRRLAERPGVTVTGSVPDVRPYLQRSALMVAPLDIARGTQNKILEAMASGVPVVSSALAAGGVDAVPGEHFLVARSAEDYAEAALRIMENPGERARFAAAGRSRMLSNHDWERSMQRLDGIIETCLGRFGERRAA
ncbi:MAG: TIGR03087 family PEP-CTERM/XrtA system glycosyltransferase [Betaproteobacteria bacterium]